MNKQIAIDLLQAAGRAADDFSREDRQYNVNKETFTVYKVLPQESTAWVFFKKNTGKLAVAFFYHVNTAGGQWRYWFVRASDAIGMLRVQEILCMVEEHNFPLNYELNKELEVAK